MSRPVTDPDQPRVHTYGPPTNSWPRFPSRQQMADHAVEVLIEVGDAEEFLTKMVAEGDRWMAHAAARRLGTDEALALAALRHPPPVADGGRP